MKIPILPTEKQLEKLIDSGKIVPIDLFDDTDEDDIPEGCVACGGPYPYCCDSCPLFDD